MRWFRFHPTTETLVPTLLALLSAALTLAVMSWGVLDFGELYSFNLRCRWREPRSPGSNVFLLIVDEGSVQDPEEVLRFGTFPWSRKIWALLQKGMIRPQNPEIVVYDIVFDQPEQIKEADEAFAEAIDDSDNVILSFSFLKPEEEVVSATDSKDYDTSWRPPSPSFRRRFALKKDNVKDGDYYHATSILRPYQPFERVALGLGHTNTPPDADAITRRFPLVIAYAGNYYPALPLVSVCHYLGVKIADVHVRPGKEIVLYKKNSPVLHIPIDRRGCLLLNYYGEDLTIFPSQSVTKFWQDFDAETGRTRPGSVAAQMRGRIVLIGSSAASTHDLRAVTVNRLYPLVGNIATAIANMLRGDFLFETGRVANIALFILIAVTLASLTQRWQQLLRPLILQLPAGMVGLGAQLLVQLVPTIGLAALYGWFSYFMLDRQSVVIPMFYGLFCLALTYLMVTLYNFITQEKSRRWFEGTWGRYMSPDMIRQLRDNPEQLTLGGEEREIAILFSDISGFTSMSEKLTPGEVVGLLNEYFDAMVEIIDRNNGMLDKYIGDAIMVHFGSPRREPDDALRAVRTGLAMQAKLEELATRWEGRGQPHLRMRVGINTGTVVAGNIGSVRRQEYTAIGDNVNIAQRLEANCPIGGVLVSQSTYEYVKDFVEAEALEPLHVKGREEPVKVFLVKKLKEAQA